MTNSHTVPLRPITPDDEPFLLDVYAAARSAELAQVPWDDNQKSAFLASQFHAQHQHYQHQFPDADFSIILDKGTPVGRLYVDRRADEIRILDMALLPPYQGRGIGTKVVQGLLMEAGTNGLPVRIFIEHYQHNALRLFERFGFEVVEDHGISALMEWRLGTGAKPSEHASHSGL